MKSRKTHIYVVTCDPSLVGVSRPIKYYVGSTTDLAKRYPYIFSEHPRFKDDLDCFGIESFSLGFAFEGVLSGNALKWAEQWFIDNLGSLQPSGYNERRAMSKVQFEAFPVEYRLDYCDNIWALICETSEFESFPHCGLLMHNKSGGLVTGTFDWFSLKTKAAKCYHDLQLVEVTEAHGSWPVNYVSTMDYERVSAKNSRFFAKKRFR